MAKQREKQRRDVEGVRCKKGENGEVLLGDEVINKQWEEYFCNLLNEGAGDDE